MALVSRQFSNFCSTAGGLNRTSLQLWVDSPDAVLDGQKQFPATFVDSYDDHCEELSRIYRCSWGASRLNFPSVVYRPETGGFLLHLQRFLHFPDFRSKTKEPVRQWRGHRLCRGRRHRTGGVASGGGQQQTRHRCGQKPEPPPTRICVDLHAQARGRCGLRGIQDGSRRNLETRRLKVWASPKMAWTGHLTNITPISSAVR